MTGSVSVHGRDSQQTGIILLLVAVLSFTLMDAAAKHLTADYHPVQIVWMRYAVNFGIVALMLRRQLPQTLRSRNPLVQGGRALTQLAAIGLFFTSLAYIGLAEATAIMDCNPVLITLGAAIFLGERIGLRRILGIAAALIGALIIIRPGSGIFHPASLLPLLAAVSYAGGAILTRLARADSTMTSILWTSLVGVALTSLAMPFFWQPIAASDIWAFLLVGIFGTIAQALMIRAFALAEAAAIAPFGYTGLIWAGLWGWMFWDTIPDIWTLTGAAIVVGAGIYVWTREVWTGRAQAVKRVS